MHGILQGEDPELQVGLYKVNHRYIYLKPSSCYIPLFIPRIHHKFLASTISAISVATWCPTLLTWMCISVDHNCKWITPIDIRYESFSHHETQRGCCFWHSSANIRTLRPWCPQDGLFHRGYLQCKGILWRKVGDLFP